ncbi:ABC transporter ATP-binding protein [Phosphitispora fastidiosa]|uniref:ABC transporter ATP-binding protein n=1 Tax=Phosphitispora fastidiosa TaxID=2837202 RepID=UPI001E533B8B|nr:ABC transporter ATP-binding protein [Phosphitispora fastidiosa]MBU7008169.1 ABC-type polysaccharide/polyol phosphate transport system ATPase subunit [Phosphitispora fastidiosa]
MAVIEVKNLWKKYRLYHEKRPSLKETVLFKGRGRWEDFWVLKNINLEIEKGTTVGLIGENGSGKSTLLKLLTKIIYPNEGELNIKGRVSSLLELGAGFHPDFTGRENIYFNSSIFGLTKKEIDKRVDDIISFSELRDFIDNPVRSYSSGMYMRLAFATAINVDPDILLIDEVLAVGDAAFQKKCFNRIKDFKNQKKTIVFVSHDHSIVEKLCNKAAWLHNGELKFFGDTKEAVNLYLDCLSSKQEKRMAVEHDSEPEIVEHNETTVNIDNVRKGPERWGSGEIMITDVKMFGIERREKYFFETGEPMEVAIHYRVQRMVNNPVFGVGFFRNDGLQCYGTNTFIDKINTDDLQLEGVIKFQADSMNLLEGKYYLDVAVHDDHGWAYDYIVRRCTFEVASRTIDAGVARIPHKWIINNLEVL